MSSTGPRTATLSFKDSGFVLSELLGIPGVDDKVAGLSGLNLVEQGGGLATCFGTSRNTGASGASI